jgi:hypothetical protein
MTDNQLATIVSIIVVCVPMLLFGVIMIIAIDAVLR